MTKQVQQQQAESAERAAEKARKAGNEPTARFFDKIARAHKTLAENG